MNSRIAVSFGLALILLAPNCRFDSSSLDRFEACENDPQCLSDDRSSYDPDIAADSSADPDPIDAVDAIADRSQDATLDEGDGDDSSEDAPTDNVADLDEDPDFDATEGDSRDSSDEELDTAGDPDESDGELDTAGDSNDGSDGELDTAGDPDESDLVPDVAVCEPDQAYCDEEGDARQCTAEGLAGDLIDSCVATCLAGVCQPSICSDGVVDPLQDETCEDGNSQICDGCESCVQLSTGTLTSASLTTSDAAWTPGDANFTLEAWTSPTSDGALIGVGDTSLGDYALVQIAGGFAVFSFKIGEVVIEAEGTSSLTDGWHHVAAVRFGTWAAAVFVDGALEAITVESHDGGEMGGAGLIWVGSEGTLEAMSGQIDEVRLSEGARYNEFFTPARTFEGDEDTLALYQMNEGTGSTVADSSDNDRTLTLSDWSWSPDDCLGTPPYAVVCGDGVAAPWESCDEISDTCTACVRRRDCNGFFDPSGDCIRFGPAAKWSDGRDVCHAYSATMYAIEDQLDNDWLTHMIGLNQSYWIGLNDRSDEGTFVWSNGSGASYRNWATDEPNDNGNEDCAEIRTNGEWNDESCTTKRGYICVLN